MSLPLTHCPACGAAISGGRAGCQTIWDELFTQALNAPARAPLPGAAFDAYCLQHPATYCISAKSYAAHLTRLCCGADVAQAAPATRPQVAQAWMKNVWEAYASQHALAHAWLQAAGQASKPLRRSEGHFAKKQ